MAMTEEEKAEQKAMVERMEKANAEARKILEEQKELSAKQQLSGTTNAGTQPEKPKEETPAEYAKRISSGLI